MKCNKCMNKRINTFLHVVSDKVSYRLKHGKRFSNAPEISRFSNNYTFNMR